MTEITKVAVIGAGVMGAAIAAHMANANIPVYLFDIVKEGEKDRTFLSKSAIKAIKKADPAALTDRKKSKLMMPCNLEDDLEKLQEVDWIIEVVLENIEVKHKVYQTIDTNRKKGSIVSSNTSTIPLAKLVEGQSKEFVEDFFITHFFNPPRYMPLLEIVSSTRNNPDTLKALCDFADVSLGKGIVHCNDTPGFIANRIGVYWITEAINAAVELGISIEEADAVMSRPIGVPKTGVFALCDLIGLDLMPLIAKALKDNLPESDAYVKAYQEHAVINKMIEQGYTGRKGKGGFYRLNTTDGKRQKEAINLKTGEYHTADKPKLKSVNAAKKHLRNLFTTNDIGGEYASRVLLKFFSYVCDLVPEISDDIHAIDQAMKWGYNWKYGPFELIDRLREGEESGTDWLISQLEDHGVIIPPFLKGASGKDFYRTCQRTEGNVQLERLGIDGMYHPITQGPNKWMLADKKRGKEPIARNPSAALWDLGDGIVCFEFTSKMNSLDPLTMEMIDKALEIIPKDYKGLVIANDGTNFSVGANLGFLLFGINLAAWKMLDGVIKKGQDSYMALKYAPFPVVVAPSGMALGGGCEIMLHADHVQAHIETYTGLVEVGVGIVPGWGGCKEMLLRQYKKRLKADRMTAKLGRMFSYIGVVKTLNLMPAISKAFEYISMAKVAKSADEARNLAILQENDGITMNRLRLLPDAKAACLRLAENYTPPEPESISLPGKTARVALEMAVNSFVKSGKATAHDAVVSKALARVLSGGDTKISKTLTEQDLLDLEREVFMELIQTKGSIARVEHMLNTGKPLRN